MLLQAVKEKPQPSVVRRKQFGLVCAALRICEKLGIAEAIDAVVPKRNQGHSVGTYIVIGILNKLTAPCSRAGISDWLVKTVLPDRMRLDPDLFSSANFWDQFEKIFPEEPLKERQQQVDEGKLAEAELFSNDAVFRIEEKIWERVIDHYDVLLDTILYDTTSRHRSWLLPSRAQQGLPPPFTAGRAGAGEHGRRRTAAPPLSRPWESP